VLACRSARATSPTTDNVPSVDLLEASVPETLRTPDVVDFGMSPFSWRRHSCLLGRDSSRPSSRAASTVAGAGGAPWASLGAADTSVRATSWLRSISPTIRNPRPTSGVLTWDLSRSRRPKKPRKNILCTQTQPRAPARGSACAFDRAGPRGHPVRERLRTFETFGQLIVSRPLTPPSPG
jgi:hypothetical protein